jgi:hypothetical protein
VPSEYEEADRRSGVWRRKAECFAMFPHGPLLVCFDDQVAPGAGRTEEHEAGLAVLSEI